MNWLAEYFVQQTKSLTLSLWAYPPLALGPDGPVARAAHCLPYPGAQLVFTPGEVIKRGDLCYELPARYDMVKPSTTGLSEIVRSEPASPFFREITIFAPSCLNRDGLVTVNGAFSFVPIFSSDGAPGFLGTSTAYTELPASSPQMGLPWLFQGYVSI
ncbi:hypothetical protein [Paraburkholderia graminis]|uniref:Uncharacterized protein n=1 Tax=Paraburkholderia graminis TaxID=60548 RepID=A0ABD5CF79_9BURK|nr:hypothetical protein [Paraburkholderia graminis]MDR6203922.1 hypothetical protein [Paraburkholderia graminis]